MPVNDILVIDDEGDMRGILADQLAAEGYQVLSAQDGEQGVNLFKNRMPSVVICDLRMPKKDGLEVLQEIREIDPNTPVIMLTAYGSPESGKEAMKLGAYNYLDKPFNRQELLFTVVKAFEARELKQEVGWLRQESEKRIGLDELISTTPRMRELVRMIDKVAMSEAPTILLEGESGTGKNSFARLIHSKSKRSHQPFLEINCASLPETLIESELFGHEKGSFTDAKQMKQGLFEAARGGTVFLDEIGEMSIATQAKLLHVIEDKRFRRLGGIENLKTDVRVIAATSIGLKEAVAAKRFREDLYFRLQLIPITIPPLRERMEDVPVLLRHFIQKFNQEYRKNIKGVSPEAEIFLKTYPWPGNVRELKNVIERIAILENDTVIGTDHLPVEIRSGGETNSPPIFQIPEQGVHLEEVERQFIVQALQIAAGNQSRAAKLLGITRHTLRYRMEKFGLH